MAIVLGSTLLMGMVQIVSGSAGISQKQEATARTAENTADAARLFEQIIRPAGFTPTPWISASLIDQPFAGSAHRVSAQGDRLVARHRTDRNCYGNLNDELDGEGMPAFYLRKTRLDITSSGYLAVECAYGPDASQLQTQIHRQGRVTGFRSLSVRFALDTNGDGMVDSWQDIDDIADQTSILGIHSILDLAANGEQQTLELFTAIHGRAR